MVRSDWLVAGPYFRVRTRQMDPMRRTAPNIYAESCGRACRTLGVLFWLNLKRVTRIYYGNPRCGIHSAKPLQNPPKKCRKAGNYFARRKAKAQ